MNMLKHAARSLRLGWGPPISVSLLSLALLFAIWPQRLSAQQTALAAPASAYAQQTPQQLQQLVAPIALYPDALVAQILAASTFPEQVVEADRWAQANPDLTGDALGQAADQQPWDPSVKALAAFPAVLGNMDKNLSWTSSLGDAYYNQQPDVMDAVQAMRQRAEAAGRLKTTPQEVVTAQGLTIVIQPADPNVVYVPAYNPWLAYGDPIVAWPGWYPYPGIWFGGPYLSFGPGFGIGFFGRYGWGWPHWGFDWHNRAVLYNNSRYYSPSRTFYNRSNFYRNGSARSGALARGNVGSRPGNANSGARGGAHDSPGATAQPFNGNRQAARGYAAPRGQSGVRSGAFSGYDRGGQTKAFSSRGSASLGSGAARGGGAPRGGSGGSRGGGGGRR